MKILKYLKNIAIILMFFAMISTYKVYANDNLTFAKDPYDNESKKYFDSITINNEDEKLTYLYNTIYNALVNLDDSVNLSKYGIPEVKVVFDIRKKVLDDHPEIFYFEHKNSFYWNDGQLDFKYIDSKDNIKLMRSELDKKVDYILKNNITDSMTNLEKVMAIHDYIVLNTEYDENGKFAFDAYGILIKGKGVCQGYSLSAKLLLNKLGIECICVPSDEMRHMWNMVNIDGEWYHMDCTWDDPVPDRKGIVGYEYFALSDKDISTGKKPHTGWDKNVFPKCSNDKYRVFKDMESTIKTKNYIYTEVFQKIEDIYIE